MGFSFWVFAVVAIGHGLVFLGVVLSWLSSLPIFFFALVVRTISFGVFSRYIVEGSEDLSQGDDSRVLSLLLVFSFVFDSFVEF